MPSALAMTRSSGVVMKPRTRSAFAPTYAVVTFTTAISLRGYCLTLSARIDCSPAMRITRFTTMASTGRLTNRSVNFMAMLLAVLRFGRAAVRRLHLVVDMNRCAVPQLEHAGRDDLLTRLHTRQHRNLVAARAAKLHHLLADAAIGVPIRALQISDDEDGVAVWCVADCRTGQRDDGAARAQQDLCLHEHAGA